MVLSPQVDFFAPEQVQKFFNTPYTVSMQADLMGMRLKGIALEHFHGFNIPSDGIVTETIQVPGHGLPIILLANRHTTGGYPKIATVISADLPRQTRPRPGDTLHFAAVSAAEAEHILTCQRAELNALAEAIRPVQSDAANLLRKLYSKSLISGVVSIGYTS